MIPICNRTHYSLQTGFTKTDELVKRAKELDYPAIGMMDYNSVAGSVEFANKCEEHKIKPIYGVTLNIQKGQQQVHLIAKNLDGWFNIINLVSISYDSEINTPYISTEQLAKSKNGVICVSTSNNTDILDMLHSIFGPDFYLGVSRRNTDVSLLIQNYLARCPKNYKRVPFDESYYAEIADWPDHRLILCSKTGVKWSNFESINNDKFILDKEFTNSAIDYTIPKKETFDKYDTDEKKNLDELLSKVEEFSIKRKPSLPRFEWTEGRTELEHLLHLCRKGYSKRYLPSWNPEIYGKRVKHELSVIEEAGLAGYFLIVLDYVNWAKNQGMIMSPGRGSVGGSIVAYLVGITEVDPIEYDLIFERFYNAGRNTPGRVSYPDIDLDFAPSDREKVIEYIRDRYGHDRVAQICTFGSLNGRGALKEVMRIHEVGSFNLINTISQLIPQKDKVQDEMKNMHEESLIRFALSCSPYKERIADYCRLDENGNFDGDYATYFEKAVRLEGTYKNIGRHASGIIISNDILSKVCPMIRVESTDEKIIGMEMNSLEEAGQIKFDILGLSSLARVKGALNLLNFGVVGI